MVYHHIATSPGQVRDHHRSLSRKMWGIIKEELKVMLALGVVEKFRSEWRSPIILGPKPDRSTKFCTNFLKAKAISRFDAYPMPRVDELLEQLGNAEFISTLDLTKGYCQIPLTQISREKTAFATPFGIFQFTTMPFGLYGAAATFQRLMDQLLQPHEQYMAIYIDDIVIYSTNWEDHLRHLTAVLQALGEAGLKAKCYKCHLGQKEVTSGVHSGPWAAAPTHG
ncbi:unnamed protein product [Caretta caretta]